ncbi:MAG: CDP-alcohol phosphatidyltransferase family protein [Candidatus Limnocylindria bacterium]
MSASREGAHNLRRGDSVLPAWVKEAVRATLRPIVGLAMALHITPNTITVFGVLVTSLASGLVAAGWLLLGAAILTAGSLLDAVDGALARAQGGGTAFGSFLDSTLDRVGEAILYIGVAGWFLFTYEEPAWPVLLTLAALSGSFLVSYSRARAEGIGLSATVGLAPRTERLVLVIVGIAIAGLGFDLGLIGALAIIAVLTTATVMQRIWHVWRQSQAISHDSKEK